MKMTLAAACYTIAFFFIWAGFSMPEAEQLGRGFPRNDAEMFVALLITTGMVAKLFGHVFLLSSTRAR